MTQEMRERMAAYSKAKEKSRRRDESVLETIRWHVTKAVLEDFPDAEFQWVSWDEASVMLEVRVRVRGYAAMLKFDRDSIDRADIAIARAVYELKNMLGIGPLRHLFD